MAILIIDDEAGMRRSLCDFLEDLDYETLEAGDGQQGLEVLSARLTDVQAMLVDLNMPTMDGYTFIENARILAPWTPLIVFSGVGVVEDALRAMRLGAWDFVTKPLHDMEVLNMILDRVLERARLLQENRCYQENLEHMVRERTAELEASRCQVLRRLSRVAEYKDNVTGLHVVRVGEISALLARALGLPEDRCEMLRDCAPLHDVGKIGVPDHILLKPGRFDDEEWEIMRQHCEYGCEILGPLANKEVNLRGCADLGLTVLRGSADLLGLARMLALCHHERWDGSGYPFGLVGEDIPLEARIVAVADVYDALSSDRPYKAALPEEQCLDILRKGAGSQFDPRVLDAFFGHAQDIAAIRKKWKD